MKIDLVYLWVDGDDPKHRAKRDAALRKMNRPISGYSKADARFVEHDELRYSLRSVEKFAPWINHVYIVTDEQTPKWLNVKNPKVTVVDHKDFIPKELLPTFNSNMIEFLLYRIPGLSEHFLYSNDDMFFGRPVAPDFFFDKKGDPIVTMGSRKWPDSYYEKGYEGTLGTSIFFDSCANALKYAYDKTGVKYNQRFTHEIEPMRKSYLKENVEEGFEFFKKTTFTPFRERTKVQRIVHNFLDSRKGRNTIVDKWIVNGKRQATDNNSHKISRKIWQYGKIALAYLTGRLELGNLNLYSVRKNLGNMPATFCINSTHAMNSFDANLSAMQKLLPEKSKFEK